MASSAVRVPSPKCLPLSSGWQPVGPPGRQGRRWSAGHGQDIVLLTSPLARGECYLGTARHLASHGHVHLLEMPGSGLGDRLASPWTLLDYVAWVGESLRECRLARPVVIGHSYSGMAALGLAAHHPEQVGALVVADAPGAGEPVSLGHAIRGALVDMLLDLGTVAALGSYVVGTALRHPRNFVSLIGECLAVDITGLSRRVQVPTLVAWGARDHTLPARAAEVFATAILDARMYHSPGGTHTWVVSQPEEFAQAVAAFLVEARKS